VICSLGCAERGVPSPYTVSLYDYERSLFPTRNCVYALGVRVGKKGGVERGEEVRILSSAELKATGLHVVEWHGV
jgi:hypothetical protein